MMSLANLHVVAMGEVRRARFVGLRTEQDRKGSGTKQSFYPWRRQRKSGMSDFAKVLVARFLVERRMNPGVSGTSGYLYHVPTILKDFVDAVTEDYIPQQNHCKKAEGVGNRSLIEFRLPEYLKGFTTDLLPYLEGAVYENKKESTIYDRGAYIRVKGVVRLRHEHQFEMNLVSSRKTDSQRWLEDLGYETFAEMLVTHRKDFDEWANMVLLTRARCRPVSSEEMGKIESLIGAGIWQRIIPVRVTE